MPKLNSDESVITKEGYWLGKGWAKIAQSETQDEPSLLMRQEELTRCKEALAIAEDRLFALKSERDCLYAQLKENEQQLEILQTHLSTSRDHLRACQTEINYKERAVQQAEIRKNALLDESEELHSNLVEINSQQEATEQLLIAVRQKIEHYEQQKQQLLDENVIWQQSVQTCQLALEEVRVTLQQSQAETEREKLKVQQLKDNLQREQLHLETCNERLQILTNRLFELKQPDITLSESLTEKMSQHGKLEVDLGLRRENLANLVQELESLESVIKVEEKQAKAVQEKIQQQQMQEQALAVRAGGIVESLAELQVAIEDLLVTLPVGVNQHLREQQLQNIINEINELGAINLAAVAEYGSESQRKQHLDEQYDDLTKALATLEAAIEKMDKETHHRLRETFTAVNSAFQSLFPRLFGGGRAMLELTCDNLLEAGILVMAQPPGKRNSTIHLLSGGEKAMIAVALVFAIFQLNPSPFCMLDEVDAPLDDVNVRRFCDLVKEMSQFVQFLFITHNKVTMELADHLIGVTMREPGVSRVVAVDVEQALAMSET